MMGQVAVQDTLSLKYHVSENDSVQSIIDAYTKLEPTLLADINWLNSTPLGENKDIRNEKARFVLMWMSGSPTVSVRIDDRVITFLGADPSILMAYMMGWTKYSIENNYSKDDVQCTTAGIKNAVNFYTKNAKVLKKDKEMDKYKKMVEDNTLVRYVADVLTK